MCREREMNPGLACFMVPVTPAEKSMRLQYSDEVSSSIRGCPVFASTTRLGLGFNKIWIRFSPSENVHFHEPAADGVQGWESDEKSVFGQSLGPKVWKMEENTNSIFIA